ncbi:MAG: putative Ig domain-containing protein [Opitutales bacterium]|nr:putative Ig domain-containing protein [Opitutales bacterium]
MKHKLLTIPLFAGLALLIPSILSGVPAPGESQFFGLGDNYRGQLGLGAVEYTETPLPIPVPSGDYVDLVSAGYRHTLFVNSDGWIFGMGGNGSGQLGLGDETDRNVPTLIPTEARIQLVSAGIFCSLFVDENGALWGMGDNNEGQLGIPSRYGQNILRPEKIETSGKVIAVSAGYSHSLFVTEDGQMWGMGESWDGQLGTNGGTYTQPIAIQTSLPVVFVKVGLAGCSYFITNDGTLWVLGGTLMFDSYMAYSDPLPREMRSDPVSVAPLEIARDVVSFANRSFDPYEIKSMSADSEIDDSLVTMGKGYSIAGYYIKSNGELWTFVPNVEYPSIDFYMPSFAHTKVTDNVVMVDGSGASAAYIDGNGTLWSTPIRMVFEPAPVPVDDVFVELAGGVDSVAVGSYHTVYTLGQEMQDSASFLTTPAHRNVWDLDPDGILNSNAVFSVVGRLPWRLSIDGKWLKGYIPALGIYQFTLVGTDGVNTVTTRLTIKVIPPTTTPLIMGVTVNGGDYLPAHLIEEPTHGEAAVTAEIQMEAVVGQPLDLVFDWDHIKGSYSFTIITGAIPSGMGLIGSEGRITGVPDTAGEYHFMISVKDWRGRGYQWMKIVVSES